jgi:WD40 repeat protein
MLHDWPAHAGKVRALGVLPDGRFAYSAGYDRCVRIWKLPEAKLVAAFAADSAIGAATVTDDFGLVVVGDAQGCAHFLELVGRPS